MIKRSSEKDAQYRLYLLKIAISHLREAYWIIHKSFINDNEISKRLDCIPGAYSLFKKLLERLNGSDSDSFAKQVLSPTRHMIFHYGFNKEEDKDLLKQIAKELNENNDNNTLGRITVGKNKAATYFEFADLLLLNSVIG